MVAWIVDIGDIVDHHKFFPIALSSYFYSLRNAQQSIHMSSSKTFIILLRAYQLLAHGRWLSPGIPASSTTKTGRHDIAEILLNVTLNIKDQSIISNLSASIYLPFHSAAHDFIVFVLNIWSIMEDYSSVFDRIWVSSINEKGLFFALKVLTPIYIYIYIMMLDDKNTLAAYILFISLKRTLRLPWQRFMDKNRKEVWTGFMLQKRIY